MRKLFRVVSEQEAEKTKKNNSIYFSVGMTNKKDGSSAYCVIGLPEITVLLTFLTAYLYLRHYFM